MAKKKGGGGTGRRRPPAADQTSANTDILLDELIKIRATFQEDFQLLSEDHIKIKLSPHSEDPSYEDSDVHAFLLIRFCNEYPYKCPELEIESEKGLAKSDAENLLARLYDQANIHAAAGKVMVFKLVEAAQKFLSEFAQCTPRETVAVSSDRPSNAPFVHGFVDLFISSEVSWQWGLFDADSSSTSTNLHDLSNGSQPSADKVNQNMKTEPSGDKVDQNIKTEDDSLEKELIQDERESETERESESERESETESATDVPQFSHDQQTDLIIARLLRLACSAKGPFTNASTAVASELSRLGLVSDQVEQLATESSSMFNEKFNQAFGLNAIRSEIPQFWEYNEDTSPAVAVSSRYLNDFEELTLLGAGGFGRVVLCENKLDGRQYAVKIIPLEDNSQPLDDRIMREVDALSRLQHQHIVRYYQAWSETGYAGRFGEVTSGSNFLSYPPSSIDVTDSDNNVAAYLYIQMERCQRTLMETFRSDEVDNKQAWHIFRQIVEGLTYIHAQQIIHRDLTPANIFFDARNVIKIADFGLARLLKLDQLEENADPAETTGLYVTGTNSYGAPYYLAPEVENRSPKIDEKVDIFSLGIIFFELWHPFPNEVERMSTLGSLKNDRKIPSDWAEKFPDQASLLVRMLSTSPKDRPSAKEILEDAIPPRMESELLDGILRAMHSSEDTTIHDKVVNSLFSEKMTNLKNQAECEVKETCLIQHKDFQIRDLVREVCSMIFRLHCANRLENIPICLRGDALQGNRENTVQLLSDGGDVLELCHELRLAFVNWVVLTEKASFKRFEVGYVHRNPVGHSRPNRYLQGDYDFVGGAEALTEAEVIKAAMDIITQFIHRDLCHIHINHGDLLEAVWLWAGVKANQRQRVAQLLSILGSLRPESKERKSTWAVLRRQLKQELQITEGVIKKLQSVMFCGTARHFLPTLKGALQGCGTLAMKALEELSKIVMYLRIWKIDNNVFIDPLIPPTEDYHRDSFFQIYFGNSTSAGNPSEGTLVAAGGRYDHLVHQMWRCKHKSNPPGAVGASLALETIIRHSSVDTCRPFRNDSSKSVLVCSRGGGGLLEKRMELVAELWEADIKAEFVPIVDPSRKEQFDYAKEHGIQCLVEMYEGSVKIRHLELKWEKEVSRESLVKNLSDYIYS